jgi:uncharacterized hydantoinase/oxoprolinase family protein
LAKRINKGVIVSYFPAKNNGVAVYYNYVLTVNGKVSYFQSLKGVLQAYFKVAPEDNLVHSDWINVSEFLLENGNFSCVIFNNGKVDKKIVITYVVSKA